MLQSPRPARMTASRRPTASRRLQRLCRRSRKIPRWKFPSWCGTKSACRCSRPSRPRPSRGPMNRVPQLVPPGTMEFGVGATEGLMNGLPSADFFMSTLYRQHYANEDEDGYPPWMQEYKKHPEGGFQAKKAQEARRHARRSRPSRRTQVQNGDRQASRRTLSCNKRIRSWPTRNPPRNLAAKPAAEGDPCRKRRLPRRQKPAAKPAEERGSQAQAGRCA